MERYRYGTDLAGRRALRLPLMGELEPSVQTVLARLGLETASALVSKPLDQLLVDLNHSEWEVRVAAVHALGLLDIGGKQDMVERLVDMLRDEVGSVRLAVVHVLSMLERHIPVEAFIEAFCDSEWTVRASIVSALNEQGDNVPSWFFMHALRDENGFVRAAALRALGTRGLITLDRLASALYDREWHVREVAALMLGDLDQQIPGELLLEALHDPEEPVRAAALRALDKSGKRIPPELMTTFDGRTIQETLEEYLSVRNRRKLFALRQYITHLLLFARKSKQPHLFLLFLLGLCVLGLVFGMWRETGMDLYLFLTLLTTLITVPGMAVSILQLIEWTGKQKDKKE